jgi:hypothetical protein
MPATIATIVYIFILAATSYTITRGKRNITPVVVQLSLATVAYVVAIDMLLGLTFMSSIASFLVFLLIVMAGVATGTILAILVEKLRSH